MAREFLFPDLGSGLVEAEVVEWLVAIGDIVRTDQPLVEVETEKSVMEIPCPYAGIVLRLGANQGENVRVGEVLVVIGDEGEAPSDAPGAGDLASVEAPARTAGQIDVSQTAHAPSTGSAESGGRPLPQAMPLVRKLASAQGIDLATITGSGPGGSITREDVEAAIRLRAESGDSEPIPSAVATGENASPVAGSSPHEERVRLSKLQRTVAERMTRSWKDIPHVTGHTDVDATLLLQARKSLSANFRLSVPLEALLIKAAIPALMECPELNATLDGEYLVYWRRYDIGVATDTPAGLIVPVVREANALSLLALAERVRELKTKAVDRTATPEELTGGTFTVSNLGPLDVGHATQILPYGTTGILSVGRAIDTPTVWDGQVVTIARMPLSLTVDHRVVDGGIAARFMSRLKANLQDPDLLGGSDVESGGA